MISNGADSGDDLLAAAVPAGEDDLGWGRLPDI
jgi:hypothetical protein